MARPQVLQKLTHDKILNKTNFPQFVDTFNYAVNRVENIRGDRDVNPMEGAISFDTTDPEHPVIRFDQDAVEGEECDCLPVDEISLSYCHLNNADDSDDDCEDTNICIKGWHEDAKVEAAAETIGNWAFVARNGSNELEYVGLSSIISGGGGGDVDLDEISVSWNSSDKVQIKGWDTDAAITPDASASYALVARDEDDELKYLNFSTLSSNPQPFDATINASAATMTFTNCCLRIARAYFFWSDTSVQLPSTSTYDVMVYAGVDHTSTPALHVFVDPYADAENHLKGDWSNIVKASVTPLYRVKDAKIACDYRCLMNVQAYDNKEYETTPPWGS